MKKRIITVLIATVLCLSLPMTAFASSNRSNNSSNNSSSSQSSEESNSESGSGGSSASTASSTSSNTRRTVENAKAGQSVEASSVKIAVKSSNGAVSSVSLADYAKTTKSSIVATATSGESLKNAVTSLTSVKTSSRFNNALNMVGSTRGTNMVINTMATVKTAVTAKDPMGNTIASAGVVKNVTDDMLIMLMAVDTDGTVEYAEGRVNAINGQVLGAFKGTPAVLTVMVIA